MNEQHPLKDATEKVRRQADDALAALDGIIALTDDALLLFRGATPGALVEARALLRRARTAHLRSMSKIGYDREHGVWPPLPN